MTGQVKEEILTRFGELGVRVAVGALWFDPALLRREEFIAEPAEFAYVGLDGQRRTFSLPANSLAFTLCQTPVIMKCDGGAGIEVVYAGGQHEQIQGSTLEPALAKHLFRRDGAIERLVVTVP